VSEVQVGVLSFGLPGQGIGSGTPREAIFRENELLAVLGRLGHEALAGGLPFPEEDRLATTPSLQRAHLHTLLEARVAVFVLNLSEGARAEDVVATLRYLKGWQEAPCRLLLYGDVTAPRHPLPALLGCGGALDREGLLAPILMGRPREEAFARALDRALAFNLARHGAWPQVALFKKSLPKERLLCLGPEGSPELLEHLEDAALREVFGVTRLGLPLTSLARRVEQILGPGDPLEPQDPRVAGALVRLQEAGLLPEAPSGGPLLLGRYFALLDLMREREATFVTLPAHDPHPADDQVATWLSDAVGPDGRTKDMLPAAPQGDAFLALSQLCLARLTGRPAFGVRLQSWDKEGLLLSGLGGIPAGPATLARLVARGKAFSLHILEADVASSPEGGRLVLAGPPLDWPAPTAALVAGRAGALCAELASSLGQRFCLHGSLA